MGKYEKIGKCEIYKSWMSIPLLRFVLSSTNRSCISKFQFKASCKCWNILLVLTFVTFMKTPSGKFLWIYSKYVSAVEPVICLIC